ncbi:MAG: RNA polymerase sigma factor [Solirubrobacteraceae bacterium]
MALTGWPALAESTDQELLRLTAVNVEAFGVFYDRHEREVLAFFWRRTGRADLAADMTSEVFARALEAAARFDDDRGSARTWLYLFARALLVDAWRHGRVENAARARLKMEPLVVTDEFLRAIERVAAAQSDVLGLLEELPEEQRLAVEGRVVDELDYAELSRRLACSESVVRARVSRGLRALRRRFDEQRRQEKP